VASNLLAIQPSRKGRARLEKVDILNMRRVVVVGIGGLSGSGKTFLAREMERSLDGLKVVVIEQDSFYRELKKKLPGPNNFDHPNAIDFCALAEVVSNLRDGLCAKIPIYDFVTHKRQGYREESDDYDVVIVEGILVLTDSPLRKLLDYKIYVDVDPDLCLIRRLKRDCTERGRTVDSVVEQYLTSVKPMAIQYVAPTSNYADYKYIESSDLGIVCEKIRAILD